MKRIANLLGGGLSTAHQDDESILLLDREPLAWGHGAVRGFAWSEGLPAPSRVSSWRDVARELAACGLVLEGDRRYLHSSVAGIAPVYYMNDGEATYFASRIDPLVWTCRHNLSIDWAAWAAIIMARSPFGDRTPFLELRRLPPFSVLEHMPRHGARLTVHEWPWAEPDQAAGGDGAEAIVKSLREVIGSLPAGPVTCPLSGGWDSRLLLALLRERDDIDVSALTLARIQEGYAEKQYARPVASALAVPLTEISPTPGRFWQDAVEVALRTDFQTSHHGWYMPLARGLRRKGGPALDGLVGDTFFESSPSINEQMLDAPTWEERVSLLWDRKSNTRFATDVLSDRLAAAFTALAQHQWLKEAKAVAHHKACLSLTVYSTATIRGISLAPVAVLGTDARVVTPFLDDHVVRAALAVPERSRATDRIYRRLFEIVNPNVGSLPSTHDPLPKRTRVAPLVGAPKTVVDDYRRYLEGSPLRGEINAELTHRDGALAKLLEKTKRFHIVQALVIFSMWHGRYRNRLREVDVRDLIA